MENPHVVDPICAEDAPWPAAEAAAAAETADNAARGGAMDSMPDTATEADTFSKELKAVHVEDDVPESKQPNSETIDSLKGNWRRQYRQHCQSHSQAYREHSQKLLQDRSAQQALLEEHK